MSFYTSISPLVDYIHSIRKLESYLSFDITLPKSWGMLKSVIDANNVIQFDPKDETKKGYSFVTNIDERAIDSTISDILKVINLNKEKELKDQLFKDTVEKLKETFDKTNLDKLEKLNFYFDEENIIQEPVDEEPKVNEVKDEQPKKSRKTSKPVEVS